MAQVTTTTLVEGPSHITLRVDLLSDGSGELINYPILSPQQLNPPQSLAKPWFRIMELWYGLVWFNVVIGSNTFQPRSLWTIARDCDSHNDFRCFGGLQDMPAAVAVPAPLNNDGVLWISTDNFLPLGSTGTIILDIQKANIP